MLNVLDFCCGCGGFSKGFADAGFKIKYAIDNWKLCRETYEYNFPDTEFILSDVTELNPEDFSKVDGLIGSPPCKNISKASSNFDLKKAMRLVSIFLNWVYVIRPSFWIMENVETIMKYLKIYKNLPKIPIIKILNCADFGVPQIRKRCFSGNYITPKPIHNNNQLTNLLGTPFKKWVIIEDAIKDLLTINTEHRYKLSLSSPAMIKKHPFQRLDKIAYTIKTKVRNEYYLEIFQKDYERLNIPSSLRENKVLYRMFTIKELKRLQTFPDNFKFIGSKHATRIMIGNAVPPTISYLLANAIRNNIDRKKEKR